jgi:DNA-binding response OmpR family regulator
MVEPVRGNSAPRREATLDEASRRKEGGIRTQFAAIAFFSLHALGLRFWFSTDFCLTVKSLGAVQVFGALSIYGGPWMLTLAFFGEVGDFVGNDGFHSPRNDVADTAAGRLCWGRIFHRAGYDRRLQGGLFFTGFAWENGAPLGLGHGAGDDGCAAAVCGRGFDALRGLQPGGCLKAGRWLEARAGDGGHAGDEGSTRLGCDGVRGGDGGGECEDERGFHAGRVARSCEGFICKRREKCKGGVKCSVVSDGCVLRRPAMSADKSSALRVLVIDDDKKLCRLIGDYLSPLGYAVTAAHTGPDGAELALGEDWSAVILDFMLPGCDGIGVLKQIRAAKPALPVLMFTGRGDESDRIVGLEIGADDYIPKTFSTRELLARLRAITRRAARAEDPDAPQAEIVVGPLRVNPNTHTAALGDSPLTLTPVEYDILHALAKAKGRVRSRESLIEHVRERNYDVFDRSIDVHISALRKKLGDDAKAPRFIRTVRAAGYILTEPDAAL